MRRRKGKGQVWKKKRDENYIYTIKAKKEDRKLLYKGEEPSQSLFNKFGGFSERGRGNQSLFNKFEAFSELEKGG